ncbi:potassium uptake protein A [Mycoplasmopsis californica]|nr:potassium uptake protein A [Mycoplasmopsis californica]
MKMKRDICVIGAGRYGQAIIEQLNKLNHSVFVLDKDEKALQAVSDLSSNVYIVDAADMKALNAIDIKEVSTVIVASPDNIEIVAALLELKVKNIIVRATSRRHARVLKQIGVHMIVRPEYEAGVRTALIATNPNFIHYSKNLNEVGNNFVMGTTYVYNKDFENKELKDLNLYQQGINVVLVSRDGKSILPIGTTKLLRNDSITFVGSIADATKFMAVINLENEKKLED